MSDHEDTEGQERPVLVLASEQPRGLAEELVDSHDGDPLAALRVELAEARRVEADAEGELVAARQKHLDLRQSPRTPRWRVVNAGEEAATAERAAKVATAHREAVQARVLRAEDAGHEASPSGRLLRFESAAEFVAEFAVPVWEHKTGKGGEARWCRQWWMHASACAAFDALWESFEVARLEPPPSMAAWMRDYLWPFMRELTSEQGPFRSCGAHHNAEDRDWPIEPAPAGYFRTYPSESRLLEQHAASEGA